MTIHVHTVHYEGVAILRYIVDGLLRTECSNISCLETVCNFLDKSVHSDITFTYRHVAFFSCDVCRRHICSEGDVLHLHLQN